MSDTNLTHALPFSDENGCQLCPRMCGVDRTDRLGFCGCTREIRAARAALHFWEEPCISGVRGSGAVFFSGCTLRCRYCQNEKISSGHFGKPLSVRELADIFLRLQDEGAHNINLVTATQYLPQILPALDLVRHRLTIPVVYNCGGYERVETVRALDGYVDIWLPDLKYFDPELSLRFSQAADYFAVASAAIRQMVAQTGAPRMKHTDGTPQTGPAADGTPQAGPTGTAPAPLLMERGVIIRHMVLPGHRDDSIRLLHWLADELPQNSFYISLMSQYTPYHHDPQYPELNRRITSYEYQQVVDAALALGLTQGFMQKKSSAREEYTPPFDLQGL